MTKSNVIFDRWKPLDKTFKMNLWFGLPKTILTKLEEYKNSNVIWTMANLRKELKKYLSTQELGDRLTKLNRNKKRHKRKLATSEDINDMDPLTPINPLDRLP